MNLGKVLIIGAHLDDIEVGIGGFLSRLSKKVTNNIFTYTACNGLITKDNNRLEVFYENMNTLNIYNNIVDNYSDTKLTLENMNIIKQKILEIIMYNNIESIYVINGDNHNDHKLLYEAVKICARQSRTNVKRLYAYQVYTDFNLNNFNCSLPFYTYKKYEMIKKYNQNINVEAIKNQDKVFGSSVQKNLAEKVKIVFDTI